MKCLLCGSHNLIKIASIKLNDLKTLYVMALGLDVNNEFCLDAEFIDLYKCNRCNLEFFNPTIVGGQILYESLQRLPWYYVDSKIEYDIATRFIDKNDNVLEIGCGSGNFFNNIECKKYLGLEFSEKAVEKAKLSGINVVKQDLNNFVCINDESYDVVCFFQTLEHIDNPNLFIKDSLSVLRDGGYLIFSVPSNDGFLRFLKNNIFNLPPHHQTRWSDKTLNKLVDIFNLELISINHERLSVEHFSLYIKSVAEAIFFKNNKYVDNSLLYKILSILIRGLSILFLPVIMLIKKINWNDINGHTVTVVYKKI
ncbi:MAG: class I SAM-dependent methyltransferase [Candidatus Falkowbacteria bacterium]